jgi:hypothetical protein
VRSDDWPAKAVGLFQHRDQGILHRVLGQRFVT